MRNLVSKPILPIELLNTMYLPLYADQSFDFSGMDSIESCWDKDHFKNYSKQVRYDYNSRGFRDSEWLEDVSSAIWCLGDSYTAGLGQPYTEIWPEQLQEKCKLRTINVSLDGASNNWIAEQVLEILQLNPVTIVIHWSYPTRRQESWADSEERVWANFYNDIKDDKWPKWPGVDNFNKLGESVQDAVLNDEYCKQMTARYEDRRIRVTDCSAAEDMTNFIECVSSVERAAGSTKIIHSIINNHSAADEQEEVNQYLEDNVTCNIPEFVQLDKARDGKHYDIKTITYFVNEIIKLL